MEKLEYEEWLEKYFEDEGCYHTRIYDTVELGFHHDDLAHYQESELIDDYEEYLVTDDKRYEE